MNRDLGLTARLPDLPPDYQPYRSRAEKSNTLDQTCGKVLIVGPQGSGKSTMALARALKADGGRGWFLDGTDVTTLLSSYADAEERSGGSLARNDQKDYLSTMAARARRRLALSERPWVVVVDNAEGDPADIINHLPNPGPNQLLIVTTTRSDWVELATEVANSDDRPWEVVTIGALSTDDLKEEQRDLHLTSSTLLPGLVRIATQARERGQELQISEASEVKALVRRSLGGSADGSGSWPHSALATAVVAASFMPAEWVTTRWVADAAFSGAGDDTRSALKDAASAGFLEHSRQSLGARDHDEMPIWMHRLVRSAVMEQVSGEDVLLGLRVLGALETRTGLAHYSSTELVQLVAFLEGVPEGSRSHLFARAAVVVMNLLESRGSRSVGQAADLARVAIACIDRDAEDGGRLRCVALMALARPVNQKRKEDVSLADVDRAIELCVEAESIVGPHGATGGVGDLSKPDEKSQQSFEAERSRRNLLLCGRAQAMRGILLKKKASLPIITEPSERIRLLEGAIDVLRDSYEARRAALTDDHGLLMADPDRHVDRGWYNLGGAYIDLANEVRSSQHDLLPGLLHEALVAYAGSLTMRRTGLLDANSMYTAASLWGVALAAYSAAVYCPGELALDGIPRIDELEPVRHRQTRETLLRAAEVTAGKSLEIRADIDGPLGDDTAKSRLLARKISLAWGVASRDREGQIAEIWKELGGFLGDLEIGDWELASYAYHPNEQ